MTIKEIVVKLGLVVHTGEDRLDVEITGGYAGDLLSDVIGNARAGQVWVTMQIHANIIAVAVLKDLAAIIIVQDRKPAEETVKKALEENVVILLSRRPTYEVVGMLYEHGIGKAEEC